ncbi:Gfo/Idh/MocA family protein [Cognatishimia activa]|uniref:1,5-anhydro-D-fructose reductase n=1 Tax=Cognatishimia activa TaxID=1715691 RepID=A0A0P1J3P6_9RHOB|nr:Gfo/Idh/MocA family oxidoreductase [Cognatishimia activa]CUI37368.1 1,5-anhydro-D-fructose reductase [Cognatishimia activa]CUK24767.1 1,5-anhydro-D-fructose reductase [Cognatishimia activa]
MTGNLPKAFRVGLIGCGRISDIYLKTLAKFTEIDVVACASLDPEESRAKAEQHRIARSCSVEEVISDPSIDCILNLTIPAAHAEITRRALVVGKHVYSEKPFVTDMEEGRELLDLANAKGLKLGNAPDTFLGGRWQTVRRLIDEGAIGRPTGVFAHVGTHGTERHHPNPDFYYKPGGGPLLDLGPYYLTAMIFCLGPVARVAGMANRAFDRRLIENGPRNGEWVDVGVDTHSLSLLEFEAGAIGSMTMSFDIWDSETPRFEIYGETGVISIPDPDPVHGANDFHGPVWLRTRETSRWSHQPRPAGRDDWHEVENRHGFNQNSRGLGLLDLAYAVRDDRPVRASGDLSFHVFEVMDAIARAPVHGLYQTIESSCPIPDLLPENFPESEGFAPVEAEHAL